MTAAIAAAVVGGLLYRLRGGWFHDLTGVRSTQLMRAIWAAPIGALLYFYADANAWWLIPALVVSVFLSLALWGHGAHSVFDSAAFVEKSRGKTELLTAWLPLVFGGVPDATWLHSRVATYNLAGMSTIGLVRHATMITPLWFVQPTAPLAVFTLLGLSHGPLYWTGWRLNGGSQAGEFLVGAAMALLIVTVI